MGKYSDESRFVEGQSVIAAMEGDEEELERLIREMNRVERRGMIAALQMVLSTALMIDRGSNRL